MKTAGGCTPSVTEPKSRRPPAVPPNCPRPPPGAWGPRKRRGPSKRTWRKRRVSLKTKFCVHRRCPNPRKTSSSHHAKQVLGGQSGHGIDGHLGVDAQRGGKDRTIRDVQI